MQSLWNVFGMVFTITRVKKNSATRFVKVPLKTIKFSELEADSEVYKEVYWNLVKEIWITYSLNASLTLLWRQLRKICFCVYTSSLIGINFESPFCSPFLNHFYFLLSLWHYVSITNCSCSAFCFHSLNRFSFFSFLL